MNGFTGERKWKPLTKKLPCGRHSANSYLDDDTKWLEQELDDRHIKFKVKRFRGSIQKQIMIRETDYPRLLTERELLAVGCKIRPTSHRS